MSEPPLRVDDRLVIPAAELSWRFDPSGGPGGQHANRTSSRAEVAFDLANSPSIPASLRSRMLHRLGPRARGGIVTVAVDESRSQWRNRMLARARLGEILRESLRTPRRRIATKPTAAARRRRLEAKRHRSETKRLRKPPDS